MVYRKGELSRVAIDREWPHQVALPEARCIGHEYRTIHLFADRESLSLCPRGLAFRRDDQWFNVFCFAECEHADRFMERFGGELIAPKDRPRWGGKRR